MKKSLAILLLILTCIMAACSGDISPTQTDPSETESTHTEITSPENTAPSAPAENNGWTDFTAHTSPTTAATELTEETTVPTQPETTCPPVTETTQHSEPTETEPVVTQPTETVPHVTEPAEQEQPTEPTPTEPAPTEPASTVHQHSYSAEVVKATCTAGGYTVHTCPCGDSYMGSQTPAVGHAYTETVTKPTMWKQGYTTYTCTGCSDSYTDNYTNISEAEKEAFIQEVREATLKYINQFRSEPAESLPGLTQVANFRAVQLHDNFAHSTANLREALAYYQYGEYKTPAGWDPSEYYYDFPGREAISRTSKTGTADEIGKRLAQNFYNSSSHWAYVGSSDYSYIAVGVSYDAASMGGYCWTCCVFVTDTNQYG